MKTISSILKSTVTILTMMFGLNVQAQMSDYKFEQQFNKAFELVVTGEIDQAIPLLETLRRADRSHHQVNYLLGMCYVRTGQHLNVSEMLLTIASNNTDQHSQLGMVENRTAPVRTWYYLAEVQFKLGHFRESRDAYRTYMSFGRLGMEEIRMVRDRINEAEAILFPSRQSSVTLAALQP